METQCRKIEVPEYGVQVYYVLNEPKEKNWAGGKGFVTADMIKERLPKPHKKCMVLRCGPPPMNAAIEKHLTALGYTSEMQFQF